MKKTCIGCLKELPISEFYAKLPKNGTYRSYCKICYVDRNRVDKLKKKYGLSLREYHALRDKQNNLCAICHNPQIIRDYERTPRVLAVDHDHETGQIRGLLCDTCNRFLGLAQDSVTILKSAIEYLESGEDLSKYLKSLDGLSPTGEIQAN